MTWILPKLRKHEFPTPDAQFYDKMLGIPNALHGVLYRQNKYIMYEFIYSIYNVYLFF